MTCMLLSAVDRLDFSSPGLTVLTKAEYRFSATYREIKKPNWTGRASPRETVFRPARR